MRESYTRIDEILERRLRIALLFSQNKAFTIAFALPSMSGSHCVAPMQYRYSEPRIYKRLPSNTGLATVARSMVYGEKGGAPGPVLKGGQ